MFIVISYDISHDRRRTRVATLMENFGTRVQYSVFECLLTEPQLMELNQRMLRTINLREDSVRFYFLSERAVQAIRVLGRGTVTEDPRVYVPESGRAGGAGGSS